MDNEAYRRVRLWAVTLMGLITLCTATACRAKHKHQEQVQSDSTMTHHYEQTSQSSSTDSSTRAVQMDIAGKEDESVTTEWEQYNAEGKLIARLRQIRQRQATRRETATHTARTIHADSTAISTRSDKQSVSHTRRKASTEDSTKTGGSSLVFWAIVGLLVAGLGWAMYHDAKRWLAIP